MQPTETSNGMVEPEKNCMSPARDEDLAIWIMRATKGHRESQKQIYDLLADRCYRIIRKIVGNSHAEDVMQDFIIHLFSKLGQFRFDSSLETWAHRMAVNHGLQYLRKTKREEQRIQKVAQTGNMSGIVNPHFETDEATEVLELAMQQISGEQRVILHMKEIEGLSYTAIASILEIPEGTVGSRLNRARNELKASLIRLGWEAPP